jgi:methyl-accepting chemotaxis protein
MGERFHNMKMSTKLRCSFGLIIGLMLCVAALTQLYLITIADKWHKIEQQIIVRQNADLEIFRHLDEGIQHFKSFVLHGEDYEAMFLHDMSQLLNAVNRYQKLEETTLEARAVLTEIRAAMDSYVTAVDQLKNIKAQGASASEQDKAIGSAEKPLLAAVTKLRDTTQQEFNLASSQFNELQQFAMLITLTIQLLAMICAIFLSWLLGRSVMGQLGADPRDVAQVIRIMAEGDFSAQLSQATPGSLLAHAHEMQARLREMITAVKSQADQVSGTAAELALAARQITANVNSESDAVSGMAAAIEELSVSSTHMSDQGNNAKKIAERSRANAEQGARVVSSTMAGLLESAQQIEASSVDVSRLGGDATRINDIVRVIKDIADQTNLLALNAAIEAARAGEQGRGFAVVADEVRKLAERTSQATAEINQMSAKISEVASQALLGMAKVVQTTRHGVADAQAAQSSIASIQQGFGEVTHTIDEISGALAEQDAAATELAKRTELIAQMSEENSSAARNLLDLATELEQKAMHVRGTVEIFRI